MAFTKKNLLIVGLMVMMTVSGILPVGRGIAFAEEMPQRYIIGYESAGVRSLSEQTRQVTSLGGEVEKDFEFINASVVSLTPSEAKALAAMEGVAYLEPDYPAYALETGGGDWVPWGVEEVFGEAAYPYLQWENLSMASVKVAVLDTGIDTDHPDLEVAGGAGISTSGYKDYYGHGTHVAGTIAATMEDAGVVGFAPEIQLYAVKVLSDNGSGSYSDIIAGIDWAIDNDMDIINMSLGGDYANTGLGDAVDEAYEAGILLVAAAGNDGNHASPLYPAAYDSVMAVSASDAAGDMAPFSNAGPAIEIMAPGTNILSTSIHTQDYAMVNVGGQGYGANPLTDSPTGTVSDHPLVDIGYGNDPAAIDQALVDAGIGDSNWIALIARYDSDLSSKIENAGSRGAAGAVIINNDYSEPWEMGDYSGSETIPAVSVSYNTGRAIKEGDLAMGTLRIATGRYETMSGTSMASPHVAGVAALVKAENPHFTNEEIRTRLKEKAQDLGLSAEYQGSGLVRADLAMKVPLALKDFTADSKLYDGTTGVTGAAFSPDTTETVDLDFSYQVAFDTPDAGEDRLVRFTDIEISGGPDPFYRLVTPSGQTTADIDPVPITLGGVTDSKVYDGSEASGQEPVVTGSAVSGEILTVFQKFESKAVGEGLTLTPEAVITREGEPVTKNYALTVLPVTTGVITARDLTISSLTAEDKPYDGTTGSVVLSVADDRVSGDAISYSYTATHESKDASAGQAVVISDFTLSSEGDGGNYSLRTPSLTGVTFDVLKKSLVAEAVLPATPLYYGEEAATPEVVFYGFVAGEDAESLGIDFETGTSYRAMDGVGIYETTLTATGSDPLNYQLIPTTTTFEVIQRDLTLGGSFTAYDKVYDGTAAATLKEDQLTLEGVLEGDLVTLESVTLAFESSQQGSDITVQITGGSLSDPNYRLSLTGAPTALASITAPPAPPPSPAPAPAPAPAPMPPLEPVGETVDVALDGKPVAGIAVITEGDEDFQGTILTLDEEKTLSLLEEMETPVAGEAGPVLEMPLLEDDRIRINIPYGVVGALQTRAMTLVVHHPAGSYTLPLQALDIGVTALRGFDRSETLLEIGLSVLEPSRLAGIDAIIEASGLVALTKPLEFSLRYREGDKTYEVTRFDRYVTRRILIPEGVDPARVATAVVIEPGGEIRPVPTRILDTYRDKAAVIQSRSNSVYALIEGGAEVAGVLNHWSRDAVEDLVDRRVILDSGAFNPEGHISRGEFARYITRALGLYEPIPAGDGLFTDVARTHPLAADIETAVSYGIIQGYPDGTFKPSDLISRQEAMVMYARAMAVAALPPVDNQRIESYTDRGQVGDWAYAGVSQTLSVGVFNGTSPTTISPLLTFRYAEAATAVRNLLIKARLTY